MINSIIGELKDKLTALSWVERYGGLVQSVNKVEVIGEQQQRVIKTFPVSSTTSGKECWEGGKYQALVPNSNYSSVVYFEQMNPLTSIEISGIKKGIQSLRARVRLVAWMNLPKLGFSDLRTDLAAMQLITAVNGVYQPTGDLSNIRGKFEFLEMPERSAAIFSRYTYGDEVQNLLLYPYDYFALDFYLTILVNLNCNYTLTPSTPINCIEL